jgi:L-rhamnose mutarotase
LLFFVVSSLNPFKGIIAFEYIGRSGVFRIGSKMAADETTQKWWKHTDPLQVPVPTRKQGEWWAKMEEVFHCD